MNIRRFTKWSLFLQWWIIFSLLGVSSYVLYTNGVFDKIKDVDYTYLSFIVLGMFILLSLKTGRLYYLACKKGDDITYGELVELSQKNEVGWFYSEKAFQLGMVGTVLGFIFMLAITFSGLNTGNGTMLQSALSQMSSGMSVALYTTATGLICGIILQIQAFGLSQYLDRKAAKLSSACTCGAYDGIPTKK
jgi:hypothetical protein